MQTISPGKLIQTFSPVRQSAAPLESLIPSHPVTSLEDSGAYRLSPTRKLVRLPVSSPRDKYREDVHQVHMLSPTKTTDLLNTEETQYRYPNTEEIHGQSSYNSPQKRPFSSSQSIRKQLTFEGSSPNASIYSEHITSQVTEARKLIRSLRNSPKRPSPLVGKCLEQLKIATNALSEIGKVIGKTANLLHVSANFLDKSVEEASLPGYYRRHEYPHSQRLMRSPV